MPCPVVPRRRQDLRRFREVIQRQRAEAEQAPETSRTGIPAGGSDEGQAETKGAGAPLRPVATSWLPSAQRVARAARAKRQKEWDEQQKRIQLEMERDDDESQQPAPTSPLQDGAAASRASLQRRQRELRAAARIQATFRGRRSRGGRPTESPAVCAVLHEKPFISEVLELE
eukprot:Skav213320  [mRNA]  locus=scaffold1383:274063:285881:+ [translate_table: standard]